MNSWDGLDNSIEKGPLSGIWKIIGIGLLVIVPLSMIGWGLGLFSEAAQVAQEEFGPRAALDKYEWFIEQSTRIEKMDQDIKLFEGSAEAVDKQYAGYGDQTKWSPDIRLQYNRAKQQSRDDLIAVVSQRNNLVREYNGASQKFNWSPFQTDPKKPKERFHEYTTR